MCMKTEVEKREDSERNSGGSVREAAIPALCSMERVLS